MQSGKDSNALSQLATPLGTISSIIEEVMSQETCVLRNFFFSWEFAACYAFVSV